MRVRLFTDGGSRGNPGEAAIGGILVNEKNEKIDFFSQCIGIATNNFAEYSALIKGLEIAKKHNVEIIECFLDSELVVKQLNKEYKVKDKELGKLFVAVWNMKASFKKITFTHIRREINQEADYLVNEALDNNIK